jgi:tetratricopeptide (TPR) repeat protein
VVIEESWYRSQHDLLRRKGAACTGVVLATDPRRNLALVEAGTVPAGAGELGFAKPPQPGDALHLITHPARLSVLWVYAPAWLRQTGHANLGQVRDEPDPPVLALQAALSEGEGGGPVLDASGALVGLVSGKVAAQQQTAYAVPTAEIRAFLGTVRPLARPGTAAEYTAQAELLTRARQYDRALAAYAAALALDRRHALALAGRAAVHIRLRRFDRALADADAAVQADPRLADAWCQRAAAWCGLGRADRAVADCDAALKLDRRCALAFAIRAQACLLQGEANRAREDAGEALWLDSKLALAYRLRGQAHLLQNTLDRAHADLTQATRLDRHDALALRLRGDVSWARGNTNAALADYQEVLKLAPGDGHALHGRGRAHLARGELDAARADLDASLRADPGRFEVLIDRGAAKLVQGRFTAAAADLAEAIRRKPSLAGAVLAEVERRTADLPGGDRDEQAGCVEVCPTVLRAVATSHPSVRPQIDKALALAAGEKDTAGQARSVRRLIGAVRELLP